ncbi:N/A [soil metagenome]
MTSRARVTSGDTDWVAAGCSQTGASRSTNMDAYVAVPERGVFVLADGVGSTERGSEAAWLAVTEFARALPDLHDEDAARTAVAAVQRLVLAEFLDGEDLSGAATLCAALLDGPRLLVVNLGDSRCYLLHDGILTQLTTDHTVAGHLVAIGATEPGSPLARRTTHHLQRYLGARTDSEPEIGWHEIRSGDTMLLSSDGLHGAVPAARMAELLLAHPDPAAAARALVDEAVGNGGTDDATALVVRPAA